jgi:hypothetical protein
MDNDAAGGCGWSGQHLHNQDHHWDHQQLPIRPFPPPTATATATATATTTAIAATALDGPTDDVLRAEVRSRYGIQQDALLVVLCPGSRAMEVTAHLKTMLEAMVSLAAQVDTASAVATGAAAAERAQGQQSKSRLHVVIPTVTSVAPLLRKCLRKQSSLLYLDDDTLPVCGISSTGRWHSDRDSDRYSSDSNKCDSDSDSDSHSSHRHSSGSDSNTRPPLMAVTVVVTDSNGGCNAADNFLTADGDGSKGDKKSALPKWVSGVQADSVVQIKACVSLFTMWMDAGIVCCSRCGSCGVWHGHYRLIYCRYHQWSF